MKYLKPHQDEIEQSGSIFSNLRSFVSNSDNKEMFYQIGDFQFTLDELKHGVIRGNKKKPGSILKTFNVNDEKAQFIPEECYDRRAIFLCLDLPQVLEHIAWFDGVTSMDENYTPYLKEFLNSKVAFDPITKELTLPSIFETYYYDFGNSNEDIIKFIWNWFENTEYSCEQVLKL